MTGNEHAPMQVTQENVKELCQGQITRSRLRELAGGGTPVVIYESTHRILKLFAEVAEELGPDRRLFVARELTKKHEETVVGTPAELQAHYATHSRKGEFVVILLPAD